MQRLHRRRVNDNLCYFERFENQNLSSTSKLRNVYHFAIFAISEPFSIPSQCASDKSSKVTNIKEKCGRSPSLLQLWVFYKPMEAMHFLAKLLEKAFR